MDPARAEQEAAQEQMQPFDDELSGSRGPEHPQRGRQGDAPARGAGLRIGGRGTEPIPDSQRRGSEIPWRYYFPGSTASSAWERSVNWSIRTIMPSRSV